MKPTPKTTAVECSVCGLDWSLHEARAKRTKRKEPTMEDCIALLQDELQRERIRVTPLQPQPYPYPVPYPVAPRPYIPNPYPWRPQPYWYTSPSVAPTTTTSGTLAPSGITTIDSTIPLNATNALH